MRPDSSLNDPYLQIFSAKACPQQPSRRPCGFTPLRLPRRSCGFYSFAASAPALRLLSAKCMRNMTTSMKTMPMISEITAFFTKPATM